MTVRLQRSTRLIRFWPYLKWSFFLILLVFVGRRAIELWKFSPPQSIRIQGQWLALSGLAYLMGWLPSVWFWRALLKGMQQPLGAWDALRAYYVGHIGKYVPGKAMVLVIRGSMVKGAGVKPLLAGLTAAYETLVFMATGAGLALAFAPLAFGDLFWSSLPGKVRFMGQYPFLFPSLVVVAIFASTPFSAWLFTKVGRKAFPNSASDNKAPPAISAGLISLGVLVCSIGWFCHAFSLGCVLQSLSTQPFDITGFPVWIAASGLSTVGGFVVLFAPGGLGVREGLLIETLKIQPEIGPAVAIVAAGLLRLVWFATEVLAAGTLFLMKANTPAVAGDDAR